MSETTRQMQEVLDAFGKWNPLPVENLSPTAARQQPELKDAVLAVLNHHGAKRLFQGVIEPVSAVEHILIPGPASEMLARIYRPSDAASLPILLYFHGGGFVLANLNSYDASCRGLCNAAGCMVVSLAYRQAPEHPYPAAREDAFAAYAWLLRNAAALGGDPNRIAVGGESAGGNLATVVCLMAREKRILQPVHQLLVYPLVGSDTDTTSYNEYALAKPLNREMMKWFLRHTHGANLDRTDRFAFPIESEDLAGLAPATVFTAEIDPLRSEGEAYAARLNAAEVPVYSRRFEGVTHEFFGMGAVVNEARDAVADAARQLRHAFGTDEIILLGREFEQQAI